MAVSWSWPVLFFNLTGCHLGISRRWYAIVLLTRYTFVGYTVGTPVNCTTFFIYPATEKRAPPPTPKRGYDTKSKAAPKTIFIIRTPSFILTFPLHLNNITFILLPTDPMLVEHEHNSFQLPVTCFWLLFCLKIKHLKILAVSVFLNLFSKAVIKIIYKQMVGEWLYSIIGQETCETLSRSPYTWTNYSFYCISGKLCTFYTQLKRN